MKIKEIVDALERFAPLPLQDGFDNAGLQVGLTEVEAAGALLCLDVTEEVIDDAIKQGCNLIVSHHPLIFHALKHITGDSYIQRCVMKAVKHDIAIYSAHTNLDNAPGGVNDMMAQKLGLKIISRLQPKDSSLLKVVTFVPSDYADKVRKALFDVGCGHIGNYDSCSYNLKGEGSFRALEGTHPFCGNQGELHHESEVRIETIVPVYLKNKVIRALLESHPYEEPAYDFYPLANSWNQVGSGAIALLDKPVEDIIFFEHVKKAFKLTSLRYNVLPGKMIKTVALCGGAGSFLIPEAVRSGADLFLTGEIKYHEFFGYEKDIILMEIGHYESEQYTSEIFRRIIKELNPALKTIITNVNTNPIKYF